MEIKRTLNNMPRLVFWRIDDVFVALVPFFAGLIFGSLLLMIGSFIGLYVYRNMRKRTGDLNLKAVIYWVFGEGFANVPSHIRRIRR